MRPRLLLDCDNVLADFVGPCLGVLESLTGETYLRASVTTWNIMKALDIPEDVSAKAYKVMKRPGFCRGLPVFAEATAGVARLQEYAHVFIVTSSINGPYWAGEREEWLREHFGIASSYVLHVQAKYVVMGDVFVDDKTSALVDWEKYHQGIPVQWVTPHNLDDGWQGIATDNWDELLGIVKAVGEIKARETRRISKKLADEQRS